MVLRLSVRGGRRWLTLILEVSGLGALTAASRSLLDIDVKICDLTSDVNNLQLAEPVTIWAQAPCRYLLIQNRTDTECINLGCEMGCRLELLRCCDSLDCS